MFDYGRMIGAVILVLLTLTSLFFQFVAIVLTAGDGNEPFSAGMALVFGTLFGGPTVALVFLLALFGGVQWATKIAGWMLVLHLGFCAFIVFVITEPLTAEYWQEASLSRYPIAVGILILVLGGSLATILARPTILKRFAGKRSADLA